MRSLFASNADELKPTKRNVLRVIAGIWDIVGFLQPIIVRLKILFMRICETKVGWDDTINDELQRDWREISTSKDEVTELRIPQCYFTNIDDDPILTYELHGFSDASGVVYGACIYLKSTRKSGAIDVRLVSAKSRVAPPKKKYTINQLELLGILILSRLMLAVVRALKSECRFDDLRYWTDSLVALG